MLDLLGWGSKLDDDFKEGNRLFGTGSYAEAEVYFAKALSNINGHQTRRASVLVALAQAQWKQGNLQDAQANAESARGLIAAKRNSSDLAVCLDLLGEIQSQLGNSDKALHLFREALEVQERVRPAQPAVLTWRCRRLAKALPAAEASEARGLLDRAFSIAGKRIGPQSLSASECLLDLGEFQIIHDERELGITSMERAIDIYREENGDTCEEAASGFQRLAHACHIACALEKAVYYYEKALHIRDRQVGGNPADLGILLMGLAEAQSLMGNDAPAIELLQQAVGKLQGTSDENLAYALERLGVAYASMGRSNEAISCHQKSRTLWERDPEANKGLLQRNAARLEAAMKSMPRQDVRSAPVFLEARSTSPEGLPSSDQARTRRKSVSEFYGPPPTNPAPNSFRPTERAAVPLVPSQPPVIPVTSWSPPEPANQAQRAAPFDGGASFGSLNAVPISVEIHAPVEERKSAVPTMSESGSSDTTAIPALVKLSGFDPQGVAAERLLSQRTLHLTVFDPSRNSSTQPLVARPSVVPPNSKNGVLSGWDDLEFDFLCAR